MNVPAVSLLSREKVISFVWQHLLLVFSLFVMTLGVALCVRSNMGSSVISTIPYVMTIAGGDEIVPSLTIGEYTYLMNFLLVGCQILLLRSRFELLQLFQLVIGFLFGWLLDVNMMITAPLLCSTLPMQISAQLAGCVVLAVGISLEIRCGSVTMPGEGFPVALSRASGIPFAKAKIVTDISLVAVAVLLSYLFFGEWLWQVVGPGTPVAMVLVGALVKAFNPYMGWFDKLVCHRHGFRRCIYGLARFIYRRNE